ncbi:MAG: SRPBCC family protein [Chlorobiaceae bacterium]|nr:SRPBCC family protein [Chlorobiaceae bacterium]
MSLHKKTWLQKLPVSIDKAWDFFSIPSNLARITPPEMMFRVTAGSGEKPIHEGMILSYILYPFMMLPVQWTTEIVMVSKPDSFEDRQLEGPYEKWQHRHEFRSIEGGVEMTDIVEYRLPMEAFGDLVDGLIVGRRLDEVFEYRRRKTAEILGRMD